MKNVIVFGDNYNDISMLEVVGIGVVMGNVDEVVKVCVDVVIGDNIIDSIVKFIYIYLLQLGGDRNVFYLCVKLQVRFDIQFISGLWVYLCLQCFVVYFKLDFYLFVIVIVICYFCL